MESKQLTDIRYLKQILAKHGITPKRSMGQNFLISPEVVEATVAALTAGPKQVTELGAGVGTLTQALVASRFSIRAIEKDDVFIKILHKQFPKIDITHADLKDVNWTWEKPYQLVGNIPYNLTGLIIRRLTELDPAPTQAILLVQAEVAKRLLANPPDMSLSSLAVQLWGKAALLLRVPRNCFWPEPEVDSALVLLQPQQRGWNAQAVMTLARPLFQHKRKQLGSRVDKDALTKAGIALTARPQELSVSDWQRLHAILELS